MTLGWGVFHVVQTNPGLQDLNISTQGCDILCQVEYLAWLWSDALGYLRLILVRTENTRGRISAQAETR